MLVSHTSSLPSAVLPGTAKDPAVTVLSWTGTADAACGQPNALLHRRPRPSPQPAEAARVLSLPRAARGPPALS